MNKQKEHRKEIGINNITQINSKKTLNANSRRRL